MRTGAGSMMARCGGRAAGAGLVLLVATLVGPVRAQEAPVPSPIQAGPVLSSGAGSEVATGAVASSDPRADDRPFAVFVDRIERRLERMRSARRGAKPSRALPGARGPAEVEPAGARAAKRAPDTTGPAPVSPPRRGTPFGTEELDR